MRKTLILIMACLGILLLAACGSDNESDSTESADTNTIQGIVWQWESLTEQSSGETRDTPNPQNYTIIFNDDGTFTGMADCNAIAGTYSQEGGFSITVGPSTLAFCGEASLDTQYIDLLNNIAAGGLDSAGGLSMALETAGGAQRMIFANGGPAE